MKKFFLIVASLLLLSSCGHVEITSPSTDPTSSSNTNSNLNSNIVTFYSLNDVHGAITSSSTEPGISKIVNYIKKDQAKDRPFASFVFEVGDMYQGSALSNLSKGKAMTEILNEFVDCGTIGNHDFDWGQDVLKENLSLSTFPIVSSNIYYTETQNKVDFVNSSVLLNKNGFKVSVVGSIGENIENSIASEALKGIYFDAIDNNITRSLKELNETSDLTIMLSHDGGTDGKVDKQIINNNIDITFLGHVETNYTDKIGDHLKVRNAGKGTTISKVTYNKESKEKLLNKLICSK